jgi:hypothetical protein
MILFQQKNEKGIVAEGNLDQDSCSFATRRILQNWMIHISTSKLIL